MGSELRPKSADLWLQTAKAALGSWPTWQTGVLVIAVAVCANLMSAPLTGSGGWARVLTGAVGATLILWRASVLVARTQESLNAVIAINEDARKYRALVVFLSNSPGQETLLDWISDPEFRGGFQTSSVRDKIGKTSWRMPIEAIAYHAGELRQIVAIASKDDRRSGKTVPGTIHDYADFEKLVDRLMEGWNERPKLIGAHTVSQWADGVDFEDAGELVASLLAVFRHLRENQIGRADAIVDVTGGTKVATVAGAVLALGRSQRFQYVSTQDYRIRQYDVTYRRDPE